MPAVPALLPPVGGPTTDLASRLARMSCVHAFRHYQELALAAFERAHGAGDRRIYLTMPPGSGKTLLGLEIGRRLGRPIVALAPTTAIRGQWAAQWSSSFAPALVGATSDTHRAAGLLSSTDGVLALTYQALVILDPDDGADDDEPVSDRRHRRIIAQGGDMDEVLGLLHPNGRAILDDLAALGPITLVLDECHRLLLIDGSASVADAARVVVSAVGGGVIRHRVVYHAVPSALGGSRERVAAFDDAWDRWVSPGQRAVRAREPEGEGILAAHRGEDPFRIETQRRTLWT